MSHHLRLQVDWARRTPYMQSVWCRDSELTFFLLLHGWKEQHWRDSAVTVASPVYKRPYSPGELLQCRYCLSVLSAIHKMRLSIIAPVCALLSGIAHAMPLEAGSTEEPATGFAHVNQGNADSSVSGSLSNEDGPFSLHQIKELATRSPEVHQDPYNITDVETYGSLYKRSVGCDPIGCFDGAFFSVIFHYSGSNGVYLYGAGQSPQRHNFVCSATWQAFNSWLPYVFSTRLIPSAITNCAFSKNRSRIGVRYASIGEDSLSKDGRCGDNGGVDGGTTNARCIFPIRP
ncbi:hypothetical protein PENCOP_c001G07356 [Penicillium coprophilum]|uniref:Uncharacterized protein n=1 Tax=Penicillium coprophilum TaxID=36646 RepID=A0A1V6V5J0_9EURO|nr:hypothetical protein PENCOP_c001G07356 [Penicillium coprophilum]